MPSSANLGQHLEDYVSELVKTGRYGSRSEVLREGVVVARARSAQVFFDYESQQPTAIPDEFRARVTAYEGLGS